MQDFNYVLVNRLSDDGNIAVIANPVSAYARTLVSKAFSNAKKDEECPFIKANEALSLTVSFEVFRAFSDKECTMIILNASYERGCVCLDLKPEDSQITEQILKGVDASSIIGDIVAKCINNFFAN